MCMCLCNCISVCIVGTLLPSNSSLYGISPPRTPYYRNFSCPSYASSINDCNADLATDPSCYTGELDYVVLCYGRNGK